MSVCFPPRRDKKNSAAEKSYDLGREIDLFVKKLT